MSSFSTIQLFLKPGIKDVKGVKTAEKCRETFGFETGKVKFAKMFSINYKLEGDALEQFAEKCIKDAVTDEVLLNDVLIPANYDACIAVAKLPGVTDDEGTSAQMALADFLNVKLDITTQHIFSQEIYYFENNLPQEQLQEIARRILGNPLINHFTIARRDDNGVLKLEPYVPEVQMEIDDRTIYIDLDISDEELLSLSKKMVLALNLEEMKAIRAYFQKPEILKERQAFGLKAQPTDCELEVLGQTWSEHCKHKEFNALIQYKDEETGEEKTINSLFKTYIRGATDTVQESLEARKNDWLVKVFTDNAGVVKASEDKLFVWKVETHNSPSALDPYGGAITGILGNNRDPLGTGVGGAKLLFNTNVLCFGPPNYDKPLLKGQLHPKRIMDGVVSGIEDGGNKSGIPTVNGSVIFDDRYAGKPLVYCGTGGLMPYDYKGLPTWTKPIDPGDRIIMAGGRIGKDGIHGATFSSVEIDEHSPQSAVQIGSPITQKKLSDFLIKATRAGMVKSSTDNGAGGLSSSVGELAEITDGAVVNLEKAPLKYAGLRPWEIFVSESQERMSLVIEEEKIAELFALAELMEVELTDIGYFTDSGYLDVRYKDEKVAYLDMQFLHYGVPQKKMLALWEKPTLKKPEIGEIKDYNAILLRLLSSLNICSRENIIRQYDHEVKGKTIVKPLMGAKGKAPQDAAVMRYGFENFEGLAVSNGILPRYGDINAYEMSCGAFDEAIRQIISVGGSLPNMEEGDGIFWSVNDNFCVPDSEFHPETNPDGKIKLAKLVQMCEGLYDMSTFFDIPMTSGKDSMKNDFKLEGVKISVPPTILYSMAAKMNDVRKSITSEFKAPGDLIYHLGTTYEELGASEFLKLYGELGVNVPKVHKEKAKALYLKVMEANKQGFIESSHDISDGGLAVTLAESAFGGDLGAEVTIGELGDISLNASLFSESHSRFVVTVRKENRLTFEALMGAEASYLGVVTEDKELKIKDKDKTVISLGTDELKEAWSSGL